MWENEKEDDDETSNNLGKKQRSVEVWEETRSGQSWSHTLRMVKNSGKREGEGGDEWSGREEVLEVLSFYILNQSLFMLPLFFLFVDLL